MKIAMIVALDEKNTIGANDTVPWPHLTEDLQNFARRTKGRPCIMGRKTAETIETQMAALAAKKGIRDPAPTLLPGRANIIISRNPNIRHKYNFPTQHGAYPNTFAVASINEALLRAKEYLGEQEYAMVIGGGEIYRLFLCLAHELWFTVVHGIYPGDTTFPFINEDEWISRQGIEYAATRERPGFHFIDYERIPAPPMKATYAA
jgi:dihydrofolate reductase